MRFRATIAATLAAAVLLAAGTARSRPSGPVRALACAPGRPEVAAALVDGSVWTTADGGVSWVRAAVLSPGLEDDEPDTRSADAGQGASSSQVIPDFEPETVEEQHRVGDVELDVSVADDPGDERAASAAGLAVGDDGSWAALIGEELFLGRAGAGTKGHAVIEGALGVHVDGRGGVWVSTDQALLRYPPGSPAESAPRRYPLVCTGPPVRGSHPGELLVTVRDGLAVSTCPAGTEPAVDLVRTGPLAAVAATPDGGWLAASRGRVARLGRGGTLESVATAPGRVRRMLVDRDRNVWVLTAAGFWFRGGGGGFRTVTALAVAVDARHRVWIGTTHGPIAPEGSTGPPVPLGALPQIRAESFVGGALRLLEGELGDPPCRPPINPLPTLRLVLGAGQGSTREIGLPGPDEQAGRTTWIYAELWLSWSFGPVDPTECVARLEGAAALRDERRRRVAGLIEAWRRAVAAEAGARTVTQLIEARNERDRLAELIRITSGIDPREEE